MDKIFCADYRYVNSYKRIGYTYTKIYTDDKYSVWRQEDFHPGHGLLNLEVWKHQWTVNPDGNRVLVPPIESRWGSVGWTLFGKKSVVVRQLKERFGIVIPESRV